MKRGIKFPVRLHVHPGNVTPHSFPEDALDPSLENL